MELVTLVLRSHYPESQDTYLGEMPEPMAYGIAQQLMGSTLGLSFYYKTSGAWFEVYDYNCPVVQDGSAGTVMHVVDLRVTKPLDKLVAAAEKRMRKDLGSHSCFR